MGRGVFGSHWDKAEATIVARQPKYSGDGSSAGFEFVADIRLESGAAFRATIREPTIATDFWAPGIGDTVSVLVKSKDGKVKFDKDDRQISVKAYEQDRQRGFDAVRNQEVGPPPAGQAPYAEGGDLAEVLAAQLSKLGFQGTRRVAHVFSNDPAKAQAALDALRAAGLSSQPDHARPSHPSSGNDPSPAARLSELETLRDLGLLTDHEYATQRQRILDSI